MKAIIYILMILIMVLPTWAATYYVDATDGADANDGTTTGTAWQTVARVNTGPLSSGDYVYFQCGETWTDDTLVCVSGVTYSYYGTLASGLPILDNSGLGDQVSAADDIVIYGVNVENVTVNGFQLRGNGYGDAMEWAGTSGATGGYSITVKNVHVLSNYDFGSTGNSWDGFGLSSTAQAVFYNISVTDCCSTPLDTDSTQGISLHTSAKAKVYGAEISKCHQAIVNTGSTEFYGYGLNIHDIYYGCVELTSNATVNTRLNIYDSTITQSNYRYIFSIEKDCTAAAPILFDNCRLFYNYNADSSTQGYTAGSITLNNCLFYMGGNAHRLHSFVNAWNMIFTNSALIIRECYTEPFVFNGPSALQMDNCQVINLLPSGSDAGYTRLFRFGSTGTSYIRNSYFYNSNGFDALCYVETGKTPPDFYYNTVYCANNMVSGNTLFQHQSAAAWNVYDNIFYNVLDVHTNINAGTTVNNCFYSCGETLGTAYITTDPSFTSTTLPTGSYTEWTLDVLDADSPCKRAASNGYSAMGSYQFPATAGNPGQGFNIGSPATGAF